MFICVSWNSIFASILCKSILCASNRWELRKLTFRVASLIPLTQRSQPWRQLAPPKKDGFCGAFLLDVIQYDNIVGEMWDATDPVNNGDPLLTVSTISSSTGGLLFWPATLRMTDIASISKLHHRLQIWHSNDTVDGSEILLTTWDV